MHLDRFKLLQFTLIGISFSLLLATLIYLFSGPESLEQTLVLDSKRSLPKPHFQMLKENYDYSSYDLMTLLASPPKIRMPDLRPHLIFQGKNGRPDCDILTTKMYFTFQGDKSTFSCTPHEKIYLRYDKKRQGNKYVIEPNPEESLLWLTAFPEGNDVKIHVTMIDQEGEIVAGEGRESFNLVHKDGSKQYNAWELGKWRVDGTLLARQKARWIGQDKFLEMFGGEEFKELIGSQRIDFGEGSESYPLYVNAGSCFIWDNERWNPAAPSLETQDKPLLVVKKVDERVMNLELWDCEGKNKLTLNLLKMPESYASKAITEDFRFVGARTKTKVLLETGSSRLILKPDDWLVMTEEGWKKLSTPEEIDAYVERKIVGPLFVFEGIKKKDERQVLVGSLITPNRTEVQEIELAMNGSAPTPRQEAGKPSEIVPKEHPVVTQN